VPDLTPAAEAFIGGCILSRTCHWPTNDSGDEVENATLDQWASVYHSPTCIQTRQRRREALAAIIAEATAQQAAEVERLRAALERLVDITERIHGAAQSGSTGHDMFCNRDDCYVVDEMAIARAALAATPVAPAPNSAPNPPAPHRCRECDDGPNLSFPEPTHAPPAPGERCDSCNGTRWVDDENASPSFPGAWRHGRRPSDGLIPCGACNEGGWDAPWQPAHRATSRIPRR